MERLEQKIKDMELPKLELTKHEQEDSWKRIMDEVAHSRSSPRFWWVWGVAASLLMGIGFIYLTNSGRTYKTGVSEQLKVTLADGSVVTMNENSKLSIDGDFGRIRRSMSMEGEVFFKVNHDPNRPFVVRAGGARVKVIGTAFNLRNRQGEIEMAVREGLVELSFKESMVRIPAGKKVSLGGGEPYASDLNGNELTWFSGSLIFEDDSLRRIAEVLSQEFGKPFEVAEAIAGCQLTATIPFETWQEVVEIITETLGLDWKEENNVIRIYGEGC